MARVLVIGYAPEATDFTDPAVPPGLDQAKVAKGIEDDRRILRERGWAAEHLSIRPDDPALRQHISDHLKANAFDCIVIGAGVRMTVKHVPVLEIVMNAVREAAPQTPVAFNASPDSSADAVARWLPQSGR